MIAYCFSTGSSLSDLVSQTPAYMYKNLGEEAVISCSHSIKDYDRILWYKQMKDGQLQFLGYIMAGIKNPEPGLGVKMDGDANINNNCTLTVEGLSENSSALYFCAASQHSAAGLCSSCTKSSSTRFTCSSVHLEHHFQPTSMFLLITMRDYNNRRSSFLQQRNVTSCYNSKIVLLMFTI